MSIWAALWLLWGAAFVVLEGIALRRNAPGDTLSEQLRAWFHTDAHKGRVVWLVSFGVFSAWLAIHIATPAGWL